MKVVHQSGKRKNAIARATATPGTGKIKINNIYLENIEPEIRRLKIQEPLIIGEKFSSKLDFNVRVCGGGVSSQTDATRLAIARTLVEASKSDALKKEFLKYDRHLLVADVRRKESAKPNSHSKARAKRQKSYR